jgi:hypothetical protein
MDIFETASIKIMESKKNKYSGIGIGTCSALGVLLGTIIGKKSGNITTSIAIWLAIGVAIGSIIDYLLIRKNRV